MTKRVKKIKVGTKRKFYGIWFAYTGECWANDYIPFIKFRFKTE